jgi:hypothetical protein
MRCFWIWIGEILSQDFPGGTEQHHKISAKIASPWGEIPNLGHPKYGAKKAVTILEPMTSIYDVPIIINSNVPSIAWLLYQQCCKGNKKYINILTSKYHRK